MKILKFKLLCVFLVLCYEFCNASFNKTYAISQVSCTPIQSSYNFTSGQPLSFNFSPECLNIETPTISCPAFLMDNQGNVITSGYQFSIDNPTQNASYEFVVIGDEGENVFRHSFSFSNTNSDIIPKDILNTTVHNLNKNDGFRWLQLSDIELFSAIYYNERELVVGYAPSGYGNLEETIHTVNINSAPWTNAKQSILDQIQEIWNDKGFSHVNVNNYILYDSPTLPFFIVTTPFLEMITQLRDLETVKFLSPSQYDPRLPNSSSVTLLNQTASAYPTIVGDLNDIDSGACDHNRPRYIPDTHFKHTNPNDVKSGKISWNYFDPAHKIDKAWEVLTNNECYKGRGAGITVGLIDAGISSNQPRLNEKFSYGYNAGNRTIEHYGTYGPKIYGQVPDEFAINNDPGYYPSESDGPFSDCAHGTLMAGIIGAPEMDGFSSSNGPLGVAPDCNMITVKGTNDPILLHNHRMIGVVKALDLLATKPEVKIISMSMGSNYHFPYLTYAIRRNYNLGKLIICAGGTSPAADWIQNTWGVTYPGVLSTTLGITGVKNYSSDRTFFKCDECHKGKKIDFVVKMQKGDKRVLSLPQSTEETTFVGGSSAATATMAGIAALVWSADPSQTREKVIEALKHGASRDEAQKDDEYGYGLVDAQKAVLYALKCTNN
ncbi:S8/S53 family peptidase [Aquimarina sp. AU119]|uniref:S8 family peptidase n=1 Tax=Aquimarina sp. AU119 TaxID=2108528 RepID=UPI000D699F18|nr:S8/S53 family peptidase [Aquimarina sp. AU119]